ncbi:MAG TPA: hypothetical protein VMN37_05515 [Gemmatimonadales bacterium]|nr:hypothetical protein [Gemmatimonadales bacterium]
MSLLGGPVGALLVGAVLLLALLSWLFRKRQYPGPRLLDDDGIDREELEEAEREVRELDPPPPGEDLPGDDWGPGAARPRPPVRL